MVIELPQYSHFVVFNILGIRLDINLSWCICLADSFFGLWRYFARHLCSANAQLIAIIHDVYGEQVQGFHAKPGVFNYYHNSKDIDLTSHLYYKYVWYNLLYESYPYNAYSNWLKIQDFGKCSLYIYFCFI